MRLDDDNVVGLDRQRRQRQPHVPPAINLPPTTKNIIIALICIYAVDWFIGAMTGVRWLAYYLAFYGLDSHPLSFIQLFTYLLIHADVAHLFMNIVGLAVLGKVLEPAIGSTRLIAMIALGSAAGAIVHLLLGGGHAILIGVSAGVGGLYGIALPPATKGYFGRFDQPIILLSILFLVTSALGLVLGFMGNIAHAAHIGGFLAGLLLSHRLIPMRH